jgi:hypothetical protein
MAIDHGMHEFIHPDDGVCGAGLDTQGTSNAPSLVNHGGVARAF